VLDLMCRIGYPVVVVTHARLGTLNHTAMTCRLVRDAGLRLAGLVINGYRPDSPDLAEATNPQWLAKQNGTTILATVPDVPGVVPQRGSMREEVLDAIAATDWRDACKPPAEADSKHRDLKNRTV